MEEKPVTSYSEESKIIKFKAKTGEVFEIEVIENPKMRLRDIKDKVINDIKDLTKEAWGDPRDLAEKWVYLSDILTVARKEEKIRGYATGRYIKEDVFLLSVTIVASKDRNKGLATFMNYAILRTAWKNRIKKARWRIWIWFQPFYIVFRTHNPILYEAISRKINVVPSLKGRQPSPREIKIATEVAHMLSPGHKFDPKTFVIEDAASSYPELIYKVDQIPWSSDKKVNEFCERHLKLTERKGNTFVVVGKVE